jgi:hypothetical protein
MFILQRAVIVGFLCLIAAAPFGRAWAAERKILGVEVSPDLKHVTIKCDSPAIKYSSFVIERPCRLVLDLESTALGSVPHKIAIGRDPIKEIRLGFLNERARVAVDFGDNVVPPFKIEKFNNDIVISLDRGNAGGGRALRELSRPYIAVPRIQPAAPKSPSAVPVNAHAVASEISVKQSGVANNMVYVELANRKNPKQSYRLVIDMNIDAMQPMRATLSDSSGNLKKYEMSANTEPSPEAAPEPARTAVGPRKAPVDLESQDDDKKKFKWGAQPAAQSAGMSSASPSPGVLFHIEEYQLEKRKDLATSN